MKVDSDTERSAQLAFAIDALRGIVIVNGGSVVALLAFFGQAWSKNEVQATMLMSSLRMGLGMFVAGTVAGISAQGLAFLAQMLFNEGHRVAGYWVRGVCIAVSLCGVLFFACGSYTSLGSFVSR